MKIVLLVSSRFMKMPQKYFEDVLRPTKVENDASSTYYLTEFKAITTHHRHKNEHDIDD
jgi:hypothetical protein